MSIFSSIASSIGCGKLEQRYLRSGGLGWSTASTLSPTDMRSKFCSVAEHKAESLTQQLASMERSRSTACRKKFTSLELTGQYEGRV